MYVRRTQTRSTATGETYFTHRLVRSERIEELVYGQQSLLPMGCPPMVEHAAQRYAALLVARRGETQAAAPEGSGERAVWR